MRIAQSTFALAVVSAAAFVSLHLGGCATPESENPAPTVESVAEPVAESSAPLASGGGYVRLGHVLDETAPTFPGDPPFSSTLFNTIPADGYKLELLSMGTHTGTHVDAPCHFIPGAKCIDDLPASAFVLPTYVLDVRDRIRDNPAHADFKLSVNDIKEFESCIGKQIPKGAIVIVYTGFQNRWGKPSYFDKAPGLSAAAVEWMVAKRGIKGLGSDTFGPDASTDPNYEASTAIFTSGGIAIPNLDGLDKLHSWGDTLVATPPRLKNGSGFQASPIGILR